MYRKPIFLSLIAIAVFIATTFTAAAQQIQLRGRVLMNGSPVKGAIVDVYRTDLPGNYTDLKTDKEGRFIHAGLPFTGSYIITVSAPGASPQARGPMRIQDTDYVFELDAGDGKRLTKDEAKTYAATGAPKSGGEESAESKKAREEFDKKKKEVDEKNANISKVNDLYNKANSEGNAAFKDNKFDEAIAKWDEALTADSTHPGAPVLLTNKSIALRLRGRDRFNKAIQTKDDSPEKTAGLESGKGDFKAAAEAASKALELLNTGETPTDPQGIKSKQNQTHDALAARAEAMRLIVKYADSSQADLGYVAYQEFIAVETDPAKKFNAQLAAADILFTAGNLDKAAEEYKKLIEVNPDSYEVYRGLGLVMFNLGYANNDKAKLQEAANYLQLFVDKAPDMLPNTTTQYTEKKEAKDILETLKNEEKIKAQKVTPTKKKGN